MFFGLFNIFTSFFKYIYKILIQKLNIFINIYKEDIFTLKKYLETSIYRYSIMRFRYFKKKQIVYQFSEIIF